MSTETAPPRVELPRVLGPVAAISCVVGSAIGSGIFMVPGRIATQVPYLGGIALVWIVAGLYSLAGALTLAELGAMLPRAGGSYVYLREAYGRLPAFLFGWSEFLVIRAGSVATLAAGFAYFFTQVVPTPGGMNAPLWRLAVAIAAMVAVAAINVVGTRVGGGVQVAGTALKLGAIGLMIVLPFAMGRVDPARLSPVWPSSVAPDLFRGFAIAVVSALWAYDGWVNAGAMAEDFTDPGRNVPRSLLWGMLTLIAVYLSMTLVYHLVLPIGDVIRAGIEAPGNRPIAAEFSYRLFGGSGLVALSVAVMCSIFIALNGNAMSGPRSYFAMARDGLFPEALATLHPRFETPANAIIVQTVWAIALTVVGSLFLIAEPPTSGLPRGLLAAWKTFHEKPLYDVLYTYVLFGGTVFYTLAIGSVFVLRRTRPDLPRPYRTWGYPVTPALYLALSVVLMANMLVNTPFESVLGLGIIGVGAIVYAIVYRRTPTRLATDASSGSDPPSTVVAIRPIFASLNGEPARMKPAPPRQRRLGDLLATSENSQLIGYAFESKTLRLQVFHPTAGLVQFQIPTDTVHGRSVPTDRRRAECRVDLIDLGKALSVVEGRYAPPRDLPLFLKHAQTRVTLAYGRRASEYRWLLLVKGQYPLLACLVADPAEIEWTTE